MLSPKASSRDNRDTRRIHRCSDHILLFCFDFECASIQTALMWHACQLIKIPSKLADRVTCKSENQFNTRHARSTNSNLKIWGELSNVFNGQSVQPYSPAWHYKRNANSPCSLSLPTVLLLRRETGNQKPGDKWPHSAAPAPSSLIHTNIRQIVKISFQGIYWRYHVLSSAALVAESGVQDLCWPFFIVENWSWCWCVAVLPF